MAAALHLRRFGVTTDAIYYCPHEPEPLPPEAFSRNSDADILAGKNAQSSEALVEPADLVAPTLLDAIRQPQQIGHFREKETESMIITRTPLRISFFGGGTDYPVWYREFGGAVLSTTIDKCCYITCRRLPPFFDYHSRVSYSRIENVEHNSAIEHPSVRGCLKFMGVEEGVEIHHVADLPARTGLGTSSAFTVGLLLGLYALREQMRDKQALALDAVYVEQEVLKEAVGSQDQIIAAYGGFNRINFSTDGGFEVQQVIAPAARLAALQQHFALFFTGFSRTASEIAKEQIKATPHRKRELDAMRQMVDEAEAIVTNPDRSLDEFGHLLHESWQIKRTLTQNITNSSLDEIYEAGRSAGALGGKLLGAGGGGFMLFFVPPERRKELRMRLKNLLCVPFSFSNRGSHVVVYERDEVYDKSLTAERCEVYAQRPSGPAD